MNESIHKYARIGLIHFMAYPETMKGEGPIYETLKKVLDDKFFTAVELSWVKNDEERKMVKRLLKSRDIAVGYGAQPPILTGNLNLNSRRPDERANAIKRVEEQIDMADELGIKKVAILSGKKPDEEHYEEEIRLFIDSVKKLCDYAQKKGMAITLEIFDSDVDKCCLVGPTSVAKRVAESVRKEYKNFGLMVDLSHLPLLRETPQQAILPVKDYIVHAHIGNCVVCDKSHPAYGDKHPRFGIKGGENNVRELADFLKVLLDVGFLNKREPPILSFEIKPMAGETSAEIIEEAKEVLLKAWKNV